MGLAAELLEPGGQLVAITPRSFANGPYFRAFRDYFLERVAIDRLHVYERRGALFADADVLQENVVLRAVKEQGRSTVTLSISAGLGDAPTLREVPRQEVVKPGESERFIHIPIDEGATRIAAMIAALPGTLDAIGVRVSTGRVVDFRTRENLRAEPKAGTAPLIYPGHMTAGGVDWPQPEGKKPNAIAINESTVGMVLPTGHYTLVKRFTAKEEPRRVVAAPFAPDDAEGESVAFENHLNVFLGAASGSSRSSPRGWRSTSTRPSSMSTLGGSAGTRRSTRPTCGCCATPLATSCTQSAGRSHETAGPTIRMASTCSLRPTWLRSATRSARRSQPESGRSASSRQRGAGLPRPTRLRPRTLQRALGARASGAARCRALGAGAGTAAQGAEVVIEIAKHSDGTLLVLPARAS